MRLQVLPLVKGSALVLVIVWYYRRRRAQHQVEVQREKVQQMRLKTKADLMLRWYLFGAGAFELVSAFTIATDGLASQNPLMRGARGNAMLDRAWVLLCFILGTTRISLALDMHNQDLYRSVLFTHWAEALYFVLEAWVYQPRAARKTTTPRTRQAELVDTLKASVALVPIIGQAAWMTHSYNAYVGRRS